MTTFTDEQLAALSAPLSRDHVKTRDQGRSKVSYIEGWHAIAEANRIFGFDGWTRETLMSECCHAGDYEKAVYQNGQRTERTVTSFRCSYRARVRVTAAGIVREGSGHGHGFADNPGEAHESAEKEAETDAMKRALMTFGNPFGLALYDKKQEGVEAAPSQAAPRPAAPRAAPQPVQVAPPARLPHPEEPIAINEERATVLREWWKRRDYGLDPDVVDGGIARWDYWFLQLARSAPSLDALIKLKDDNREFHKRWYRMAAVPVSEKFGKDLGDIEARLVSAPAVAAQ